MKPLARQMFAAAFLMGAFWHIWNIFAGEIPSLEMIALVTETLNPDGTLKEAAKIWDLPFGMSRSWDVFGAMIFVWIFGKLWRTGEKRKDLDSSLFLGLVLGLVFGLVLGLVAGLSFGLLVGLVLGLVASLFVDLNFGLMTGLIYSLVVGLFWIGLVPGLDYFALITSPLWLFIFVRMVWRKLCAIPWSRAREILSSDTGPLS